MKRTIGVAIAMLLLAAMWAASTLALAQEGALCDDPPQVILEQFEQIYDRAELADYIAFQMPDGSAKSFLITHSGLMEGYRCEDGEWTLKAQVMPVDGRWKPRFERHDPAVPRADGSFYPDALGFDLVCEESGNRISYHDDGTDFVVCGWKNPSAYDGEVLLTAGEARYIPAGQREAEAVCRLNVRSLGMYFDDLPFTPQEGAAMAAITEESVSGYFPGYDLREIQTYNAGHETFASYSRLEDGMLLVKRATFTSARPQPEVIDCMPIPLSASLLSRLETEGFDGNLLLSGDGSLFCTDDALDLEAIPVPGRIVDSDLQRHALLLLTEADEGARRLCVVTQRANGYAVATTPELPEGVYLDLFHAGDGDVQFEWSVEQQGETQYRSAAYRRLTDGNWRLAWASSSGASFFDFSAVYCGVREEWTYGSLAGVRIGGFPAGNLMQADLNRLPASSEELEDFLDRSGWAVVCNPNPADRLHLRAKPERGAKSLGKFYNGTPVQVLRQWGDWCEVAIGLDGCLTGWMMKQYLVFGEAMDKVENAFPPKIFREEYEGRPLYTSQEMNAEHGLTGEYWVVGVVGDELYIVLTANGGTGYAPQAWFWEGNG